VAASLPVLSFRAEQLCPTAGDAAKNAGLREHSGARFGPGGGYLGSDFRTAYAPGTP